MTTPEKRPQPPDGWVLVAECNGALVLGEPGGDLDRPKGKSLVLALDDGLDVRRVRRVYRDAKLIGTAILPRHRLLLTGAMGTASVEPDDGFDTYGLLWEVEAHDLGRIDHVEGVPHRSKAHSARVIDTTTGEEVTARYYVHSGGRGNVTLPSLANFRDLARLYVENDLPLDQLEAALHLCV
jgi:hypothetical protein